MDSYLIRDVAAEYNDLPAIKALLQRWQADGYPDLGGWPARFASWEELVRMGESCSYSVTLTPNAPAKRQPPGTVVACKPNSPNKQEP
jgi:hypothetical protein